MSKIERKEVPSPKVLLTTKNYTVEIDKIYGSIVIKTTNENQSGNYHFAFLKNQIPELLSLLKAAQQESIAKEKGKTRNER